MAQFLSDKALEDLTQFEIRLEGLSERIVHRNAWRFTPLDPGLDTPRAPNPSRAPNESKGQNWGAGSIYLYCRGVLTKLLRTKG
jgi:hypothetical protein